MQIYLFGNALQQTGAVPLVADFPAVTITADKLSAVRLEAGTKPEGLVRALLLHFFTLEQLAAGCAIGLRPAANKTEGKGEVKALNPSIIAAIKRKNF